MKNKYIFSSEAVTEGHPDKLCDQVSDAIVDRFLENDPFSHIGAECAVATGVMFIATRFASTANPDVTEVAREVIKRVGYDKGVFNAKDCTIITNFHESPTSMRANIDEREMDDDALDRIVADHQVTVFGYACDQTENMMPLPITLAQKLAQQLAEARIREKLNYLSPDGTISVAVEFSDRIATRIHSITLIASQESEDAINERTLYDDLYHKVIESVFSNELIKPDKNTKICINPGGAVISGGPAMHAGLTGRKNAADTYGLYSRNSSAALSGKGPDRIDRIGAYAARYAAKNVVAAGLARECEIALSYSIGNARPVSIQVDTFGTGKPDDDITKRIEKCVDLRVGHIISKFKLRHLPVLRSGEFYQKLACYGQVGRTDMTLPWEDTDLIDILKEK